MSRSWAARLALLITLHCARLASAQTAPLSPDISLPPTRVEIDAARSKIEKLYEEFRALKSHLPFRIGAGMYLFYYQPVDYTTFAPTDRTGSLDLYAFYLKLDGDWHGLGAHTEMRIRDGGHIAGGANNDNLRPFFTSNFWFQELYAYYTPGPYVKVKAGKAYRNVGLLWDDSFYGNILYMDGLKLNPDWGLSVEGSWTSAGGRFQVDYSTQYFLQTDGITGAVTYGRGVGPAPGQPGHDAMRYLPAPEAEMDSAGNRMTVGHHLVTGRVAASARPRPWLSVQAGVSGLTGVYRRSSIVDKIDVEGRATQVAADLTFSVGPVTVFGEYERVLGPGMRDADYAWAGARFAYKGLQLRMNASYVRYTLTPDVQEYLLLPGVSYTVGGLTALVEYDEWRRRDPRRSLDWEKLDRAVSVVLAYNY